MLLRFLYNFFLPGSTEELADSKRQRLRPGKVSPIRPVPNHIPKPPYVKSRKPPGIASGPEIHNERGIACMRASGRLAAQVLLHAGTLVKVHFAHFLLTCLARPIETSIGIRGTSPTSDCFKISKD